MYKKISDYALIGNLHSVALIGLDGSIDWLCLPHIDSPSVFGALLDDKKGGHFSVTPAADWDSAAGYLKNTNILLTKFRTRTGIFHLIDFMPVHIGGEDDIDEEHHKLYRLVEVKEGTATVNVCFEPRFDYARDLPLFKKLGKGIMAKGKRDAICLCSSGGLTAHNGQATAIWYLKKGDRVWLYMNYGEEKITELNIDVAERALHDTEAFWKDWLAKSETGVTVNLGPYEEMVNRSALALKLLYHNPKGTISAAATTSLPEEIGGIRNWDYRYTWVRDASFTLQALFNLGHISEMEGYLRWIEQLISEHGTDKLQIMYGLRGESELTEQQLLHLDGYKGSRPVRIGNSAAKQKQLDIYGEIMDAALKLSDYVGKIDRNMWPFLRSICDYVVNHWMEKDFGIWEVRGGPYHFVYSKVMCWVALDRGIIIAQRYGFPADLKKWETTREEIREEVLRRGYNEKKNAFIQHFDTEAIDSSNLLIPIFGFLPYDDPRISSTLEITQRELGHDGLLYRYISEDGLQGKEGTFLLCSFWLIDNLIALGRLQEAETYLHRMETIANHVGLFSEEYDITWSEQLGNFPQAFTHIGYINSVLNLCKAKEKLLTDKTKEKRKVYSYFLPKTITLNNGVPTINISSQDIIAQLKHSMNILRGAFFDTRHGRVAYERMHNSKAYKDYVELSYSLKTMDIEELKSIEEKLAFWINLYNVIVIHGVIELGIRDSVKEVRNFFKRIQYQIGSMFFSPDDIEHGILRSNSRLPNSFFHPFRGKDKRLQYIMITIDPRIHFSLVCASSSCPPIEIYTPENINKELTISGETFLNSGGIIIDREKNHALLSRIFKWYGQDFGENEAERLRFIAPYLYDEESHAFLQENADTIKVDYLEYDWRLNRY